jgi:hypothetical protein
MELQHRRYRWIAPVVAIALAAFVGFFAYNAGLAHGIATASQQIAGGAPPVPPYGYYGWYRPWGFGLFGPFFFILLWLLVLRGFFWGGPWRRYGCSGAYYGRGPSAFDEWHRQAHERMTPKEQPGSPTDADRSRR